MYFRRSFDSRWMPDTGRVQSCEPMMELAVKPSRYDAAKSAIIAIDRLAARRY
jgi:hypothetical protein